MPKGAAGKIRKGLDMKNPSKFATSTKKTEAKKK